MQMYFSLLIMLPLVCYRSPNLLAGSQKDLLETAATGHRAARESVHTFYCQVSVASDHGNSSLLPRGEYWRSLDDVRIRSQRGSISEDVLVQNARIKSVVKERTPRGEKVSASIAQANQSLGQCDVWRMGLLTFFGPQDAWVTLDELLKLQVKLREARYVSEGETRLVYISLEHSKAQLDIWLDPRVNYLARRMHIAMTQAGPRTRGEHEVVRFKEVVPGIYFPERIEVRGYTDNQLEGTTIATFGDIRINQSLGPDVFKLHYPPGTKIMDTIQGKFYTVDSEGRPTGEVRNMQVVTSPPLPVGTELQTVTEFEPKSAIRWIIPVSLSILGVGITAWFIRHRMRKQSVHAPD